MTTTVTTEPVRSARAGHRRRRLGAIVAAMVVNAVLWGVAAGLGADFRLTDSTGSGVITLPVAVLFTGIFGLLGWASLAVLERWTRRARAVWTGLAGAVALLSIVPIFLEHATGATRAALTVLHLAVAAVLVPGFRPGRR